MISHVKTVLNIPDCYYPTIIEFDSKYHLIYRTYVEHNKTGRLSIDLEITKIITSDRFDYFDINDSKLFLNNLKGKSASVNHNFALFYINNQLLGVGGVRHYQFVDKSNALYKNWSERIPLYRGISLIVGSKISDISSDRKFDLIIRKHLQTPLKISVFDSNISMIYFKNKYMIYARHNVNYGQRSIQIYQSESYNNWDSKPKLIELDKNEYNHTIYSSSIFTVDNKIYGFFSIYDLPNNPDLKIGCSFIKYHPTKYELFIGKSENGINFKINHLDKYTNHVPIIGTINHLTESNELFVYLYNMTEKSIELYKLNVDLI